MDGEATEGRPTPSNRSSPPRLVFPDRRDGPHTEGYIVSIYQTAHVVISTSDIPHARVKDNDFGEIVWQQGDLQSVVLSAFDAEAMQQLADVAAQVAADMRAAQVAKTLAMATS